MTKPLRNLPAALYRRERSSLLMTRTRKRMSAAVRRTSVPRLARRYSGLLAKLSAASAELKRARPRR